jgi:catechol 2,3-dioxygenase-like lactoylglutathione lyase family enzyme
MPISLSHFEIRVRNLPRMEEFYTGTLGFLVTDRSAPGGHQMVFLSGTAGEHHQIVLAESDHGAFPAGTLDHLAFRIRDLASLRRLHGALQSYGGLAIETVSHGTTWSIYFRDPEGNRIELFVSTPWHVAQPLRFPIDLSLPDDDLMAWTEEKISSLPDFQPVEQWLHRHRRRIEPNAT